MSLPLKAVDRLFERLGATYCAAWDRSLGSAPISDVKSVWAHELAGFADKLGMLAWALENLPERCPNVIEFKALCRRAPVPETQRLPEPSADPERVRAELAKLGHERGRSPAARTDRLAWAQAILDSAAAGVTRTPTVLRFAREALGIHAHSAAHK